MPTENRSSNTEMVSVPRKLLEIIRSFHWTQQDSTDLARAKARAELIDLLAKPAEQHQGEPVAYAVFTDNGNIRIWSTNCAAVAIKVMREEGKQVVPLYANSAPSATAEVERLREELDAYEHGSSVEAEEADSLRKQLAEAHALLREVLVGLWPSTPLAIKINAALSASAEPSAPVEIDERADFERHVILTTGRPIDSELKRHPVRHDEYECRTMQTRWNDWQARAALDRKPS
ncbi:hypothetical protein R4370_001316 [Pseudomonas putida]|nr:hypothetical protein [Pseudomonas putida]